MPNIEAGVRGNININFNGVPANATFNNATITNTTPAVLNPTFTPGTPTFNHHHIVSDTSGANIVAPNLEIRSTDFQAQFEHVTTNNISEVNGSVLDTQSVNSVIDNNVTNASGASAVPVDNWSRTPNTPNVSGTNPGAVNPEGVSNASGASAAPVDNWARTPNTPNVSGTNSGGGGQMQGGTAPGSGAQGAPVGGAVGGGSPSAPAGSASLSFSGTTTGDNMSGEPNPTAERLAAVNNGHVNALDTSPRTVIKAIKSESANVFSRVGTAVSDFFTSVVGFFIPDRTSEIKNSVTAVAIPETSYSSESLSGFGYEYTVYLTSEQRARFENEARMEIARALVKMRNDINELDLNEAEIQEYKEVIIGYISEVINFYPYELVDFSFVDLLFEFNLRGPDGNVIPVSGSVRDLTDYLGESRINLATASFQEYLERRGLSYFRESNNPRIHLLSNLRESDQIEIGMELRELSEWGEIIEKSIIDINEELEPFRDIFANYNQITSEEIAANFSPHMTFDQIEFRLNGVSGEARIIIYQKLLDYRQTLNDISQESQWDQVINDISTILQAEFMEKHGALIYSSLGVNSVDGFINWFKERTTTLNVMEFNLELIDTAEKDLVWSSIPLNTDFEDKVRETILRVNRGTMLDDLTRDSLTPSQIEHLESLIQRGENVAAEAFLIESVDMSVLLAYFFAGIGSYRSLLGHQKQLFWDMQDGYISEIELKKYVYMMENPSLAREYRLFLQNRVNKERGFLGAYEIINDLIESGDWQGLLAFGYGLLDGIENFFEGIGNLAYSNGVLSEGDYRRMFLIQAFSNQLLGEGLTEALQAGIFTEAQFEQLLTNPEIIEAINNFTDPLNQQYTMTEFAAVLKNHGLYDVDLIASIATDINAAQQLGLDPDSEFFSFIAENGGFSSFVRRMYTTGISVGNLLPTMAVGLVLKPVGGVITIGKKTISTSSMATGFLMGGSIFGNELNEALAGGATRSQAIRFALARSISEVGLQKMLGNIGIINPRAKFALTGFIRQGVIEGASQELLRSVFASAFLGQELEFPSAEHLWDAFIGGVLTSAITTGPSVVTHNGRSIVICAQTANSILNDPQNVNNPQKIRDAFKAFMSGYSVINRQKLVDASLDNPSFVINLNDNPVVQNLFAIRGYTPVVINGQTTFMNAQELAARNESIKIQEGISPNVESVQEGNNLELLSPSMQPPGPIITPSPNQSVNLNFDGTTYTYSNPITTDAILSFASQNNIDLIAVNYDISLLQPHEQISILESVINNHQELFIQQSKDPIFDLFPDARSEFQQLQNEINVSIDRLSNFSLETGTSYEIRSHIRSLNNMVDNMYFNMLGFVSKLELQLVNGDFLITESMLRQRLLDQRNIQQQNNLQELASMQQQAANIQLDINAKLIISTFESTMNRNPQIDPLVTEMLIAMAKINNTPYHFSTLQRLTHIVAANPNLKIVVANNSETGLFYEVSSVSRDNQLIKLTPGSGAGFTVMSHELGHFLLNNYLANYLNGNIPSNFETILQKAQQHATDNPAVADFMQRMDTDKDNIVVQKSQFDDFLHFAVDFYAD